MLYPLQMAGAFLINTIFEIFITLVLIRLFLEIFKAGQYNPIFQFIIKITEPLVKPFRKFLPKLLGIISLLFVLQFILLGTLLLLNRGEFIGFNIGGILLIITGKLLDSTLTIFTFSIILYVILSWFPQATRNPAYSLLNVLTYPILAPLRNKIPPIASIDISPIIGLILIQLLRYILVMPILMYGQSLMF